MPAGVAEHPALSGCLKGMAILNAAISSAAEWRRRAAKLRELAKLVEDIEFVAFAEDCERLAAEIERPRGHTAERWRGRRVTSTG
jgi:hypothetical protein